MSNAWHLSPWSAIDEVIELATSVQLTDLKLHCRPAAAGSASISIDLSVGDLESVLSSSISQLLRNIIHKFTMGESNPGAGHKSAPVEVSWLKRDVLLFASSIGATAPDELNFLYVRAAKQLEQDPFED